MRIGFKLGATAGPKIIGLAESSGFYFPILFDKSNTCSIQHGYAMIIMMTVSVSLKLSFLYCWEDNSQPPKCLFCFELELRASNVPLHVY